MATKIKNSLRGVLVIIPLVFIMVSVISNCSSTGNCDGDVTGVATEADCTAYAEANDCETSDFSSGTCQVTGCGVCEVTVDDSDFVIDDIDDEGFIDDGF